MNRLLRLALTCLLLAALPLQGYAAAGMLFCGGGTGAGTVVHDHARQAADGHHDRSHRHADDPGDAAEAQNLHDATHGTCSACASCCSVAALPTASMASASAVPPPAPVVRSAAPEPRRIAARLERPPRLHLA